MDRLRIVDEIAAIGRGLVKLSEAHRKASSGDLDLINQVQVATTRAFKTCEINSAKRCPSRPA